MFEYEKYWTSAGRYPSLKKASVKQNSTSTFYPRVNKRRELSPSGNFVGRKRTELFMRRGCDIHQLEMPTEAFLVGVQKLEATV